jgi:hypothetical protein
MRAGLSRASSLLAILFTLLPHRSTAPRGAPAASRARSPAPSRAPATPFFTYPQALRLLALIEGTERSAQPLRRARGTPHELATLGSPSGRELLDRALDAGDGVVGLAREMRALTVEACNLALSAEQRALLESAYLGRLARLADLTSNTRFKDIPLIDGSCDVELALPPTGAESLLVDLPDWRASALDLPPTIATLLAAQQALDSVDVAVDRIVEDRLGLSLARQELLEGEPAGGLRELERLLRRMRALAERACNGVLNTGDRTPLDRFLHSDLARLDAVAAAATYEGFPLLGGGEVLLQGALGNTLFFALPDVGAASLGLPLETTDLTSVTSATATLETLGEALREVRQQREAVVEAREELSNDRFRMR